MITKTNLALVIEIIINNNNNNKLVYFNFLFIFSVTK